MELWKSCPHCGAQLPEGASFCPFCARSVKERREVHPPRYIPGRALRCALLALVLLAAALTGCGPGKAGENTTLSPAARTELYKNAIESARDQEMNEAVPVITSDRDDLADFILPMLGVTGENASAYAMAVSPMNVRAYGIAAVFPAAGKDEEVLEGLRHFRDTQERNFEQYLADQYEIAQNTRMETLEDGTILLVMCDDQDAVFDAIRDAIERAQ